MTRLGIYLPVDACEANPVSVPVRSGNFRLLDLLIQEVWIYIMDRGYLDFSKLSLQSPQVNSVLGDQHGLFLLKCFL